MRTLRFVTSFVNDEGASDNQDPFPVVQGVFDEKGECLGSWCVTDARFELEYFSPFLARIGVHLVHPEPEEEEMFKERLSLQFDSGETFRSLAAGEWEDNEDEDEPF